MPPDAVPTSSSEATGPYTAAFFDRVAKGSATSARAVIPLLLELVRPRSIVDVGCGEGTWLRAARHLGVDDVVGIDGAYVDTTRLVIPAHRFLAHDLTQPLRLGRRFDLALSLEVAEHLPAAAAETFVSSLVGLAPVVAFSAAIPHQGGTGHLNEQWPEYWVERFEQHGYVAVDSLRRALWDDDDVEHWYAQNLLTYVDRARLDEHPALRALRDLMGTSQLSLVHPKTYLARLEWECEHRETLEEIDQAVGPATAFIVVDDGQVYASVRSGRRAIPFLERDGDYWGPPADDSAAIAEVERLRAEGAQLIVFTAHAFWWLEHYRGFRAYLDARFARAARGERVVVYDLRAARAPR